MTPGRPVRPVRRRVALLAVALAVAASAACGGDDNPAPPAAGKPEKATIKVGVLPIIDTASLHLGIRRGLFAAEGLTVEPVTIEGGAKAVPLLQSGELDLSFGNYVSFFLAESKGLRFKIAADGYQARPNVFVGLTLPNSPVKSVKDLAGKKVAVNTNSNIVELTAKSVLKTNAVDPALVTFVPVPFPDMAASLQRGDVAAAVMVEPFISGAEQRLGATALFDAASGPTADIPIAGYAATEKWAGANPVTFAAFARAMTKAQELAGQRKNVEEVLPTYTKIDSKTAAVVTVGTYPTTLNEVRLRRVADLMQEFGLTKSPVDVAQLLG